MSYIILDALDCDRDAWVIKVRVYRMWESTNPNTGEQYNLDMILTDEKVNKLTVGDKFLFLIFYNICFVYRTCLLLLIFLWFILYTGKNYSCNTSTISVYSI